MSDPDFENRKTSRRQSLQQKLSMRHSDNNDARDQKKLKKEFKRNKESLRQEELWDDWEDEIS